MNRDRSSDQNESYYQYKIPLFPDVNNELEWNEFVTDSVHITSGTWYRFKVPISQYDDKIGSISDFRSIKFLRMYLTEFEQPITFRFATLDLVRNTWRRYSRDNLDDSRIIIPSDDDDEVIFDLNAVNIEEHSNRKPYPYALPPGIDRERAYNSYYANAVQNEQSLSLEVCNLPDGRSKGIYKILNLDLRNYENLKMFIHMEESEQSPVPVEDGDLRLFVRLGSDFTQNFYEYEMPLVNSPDLSSGNLREVVWPQENNLDLDFELLRELKIQRNNVGNLADLYTLDHPEKGTVSVKGNPNLGYVKNIMIGLRNYDDSKGAICAEVWINELRVGGLNEEGGVAALARADIKLADLGNVAFAGNYSSIGWGALDEKLAERSIEEVYTYDISSNLQLGRFFPKEWSINLPFYGFYGSEVRTPKYDPYDLDIELKDKIAGSLVPDVVRDQAIDYTAEKGISFTDVKKDRTKAKDKKPMPWDISNFSVSYNYKDIEHHDPILEKDNTIKHTGGIDYNYNRGTKYLEPFKNKIKNDKILKPIKDFNFNPLPNSFSFRTYLDKHYNQKVYRFEGTEWADRRFTWDRDYSLRWNFTKALKFDFDANTETLIDELDNFGNDIRGNEYLGTRRDYVMDNIRDYGRKKRYYHRLNLGYTLPTRSIPAIDWMTVRGQVKADFTWNAASINVDSLGHVLQNSQDRSVNADFDFLRLYNKSKYLSSINKYGKKGNSRTSRPANPRTRGGKDKAEDLDDKDDPAVAQDDKASRKKKGKNDGPGIAEVIFIRPLMSLRKVRFSYTERHRSIVPGFTETPEVLGLSQNFLSPGWQYVTGFMPDQPWLDHRANNEDWFTESLYFNEEVFIDTMQDFSLDVSLEPYNDLKIEVNVKKSHNRSYTEIFANDDPNSKSYNDRENFNFAHQNRREFGTYTITYFSANTMFFEGRSELYGLFKNYEENRKIISKRLALDPNSTHSLNGEDYTHGFGKLQKDVLIPAFIAAYTDKDPNLAETNFLKLMPLPNWKITYNGLSKIAALSNIISSFELSHGYESTFMVNSYNTNIDYQVDPGQDPRNNDNLDNNVNYNSKYELEGLIIDERFRPLIGLNLKTANDLSLNFEINKARNLRMDFANNWLNEMKSSEYVFGFSYLLEDVYLPLPGVEKKTKKSRRDKTPAANKNTRGNTSGRRGSSNAQGNDMQINFDFSIRDDITLTHVLDQGIESKPTNGRKSIRISPSVDYQVNDLVGLRLFVDYDRTIPYTSLNYNTTRIDGGLTVTVTFK